jgi:hypothetical protein
VGEIVGQGMIIGLVGHTGHAKGRIAICNFGRTETSMTDEIRCLFYSGKEGESESV